MKRISIAFLLIFTIILCTLCGCDSKAAEEIADEFEGKWAYVHDTETPILVVKKGGKAEYKGESYTYSRDDEYITLTDGNGSETRHRYSVDTSGIYVYEETTYHRAVGDTSLDTNTNPATSTDTDTTAADLIGLWIGDNNKWSFEFTASGEFKEDGYFPGLFTVDEAAGTVKLVYNDHFADTICYYHIEGGDLVMEYPWLLVKMD